MKVRLRGYYPCLVLILEEWVQQFLGIEARNKSKMLMESYESPIRDYKGEKIKDKLLEVHKHFDPEEIKNMIVNMMIITLRCVKSLSWWEDLHCTHLSSIPLSLVLTQWVHCQASFVCGGYRMQFLTLFYNLNNINTT